LCDLNNFNNLSLGCTAGMTGHRRVGRFKSWWFSSLILIVI